MTVLKALWCLTAALILVIIHLVQPFETDAVARGASGHAGEKFFVAPSSVPAARRLSPGQRRQPGAKGTYVMSSRAERLPAPVIMADGAQGDPELDAPGEVSLWLGLETGRFRDAPADWWLIQHKPDGSWYSYDIQSGGFVPGVTVTLQHRLVSFPVTRLISVPLHNSGAYSFYFGVDLERNGRLDADTLFYTQVNVRAVRRQPSQRFTVYNQAYQENFAADSMDEILASASGAYVLLDPFSPEVAEKIQLIKQAGNQVGCYVSIGTGEEWRQDFQEMRPFLVEEAWSQWEGEYFVNRVDTGVVDIMKARIRAMAGWQCDWIEFDNMDWAWDEENRQRYGFRVTEQEATAYFELLCRYAHSLGMKCMAKNMTDPLFDGVLYESCHDNMEWWERKDAEEFLHQGKPVIINHYNETDCDGIYDAYRGIYGGNISFICEDVNIKGYVHY